MTSATTLRGFEERSADAKAVRMRYFVGGAGPPLVLVHGWTGAAANWIELAPRLAARHRVLVPDLPGHGGSAPLPAAPNLDAYADRVRLVVEREEMLPAPLVGHSLGGVVALRLALRHPGDVTAVVLAGAAGISTSTRRAEFWISFLGLTRPGKLLARARGPIARHGLLRRLAFNPFTVADPVALSPDAVHGLLGETRMHADVRSAGRALIRADPREDLDGVRCPCLVLWGASDLQVPIDDAFEYARRLRAPLRTIADCGHLLIVERPDACRDAIEEFLHSVAALRASTG